MPNLFIVAAAIAVGTAFATYLLKVARANSKSLLASSSGKLVGATVHKVCERLLNIISVSDPLVAPTTSIAKFSRGYLESLPQRRGSRPEVDGISSPIQRTQLPPWEKQDVNDRLRKLIIDIPDKYPQSTYLGRSTFEPDSPTTLYARHRAFDQTKYYGEILSANTEDGFIHSSLHPCDVKTVIEKGWGQRHPLSGRLTSRLTGLVDSNLPSPVAGSRVLIYAPRNEEDLEVVEEIIKAAVWWVGGVEHKHDEESIYSSADTYEVL
jgi:hypothetical protein